MKKNTLIQLVLISSGITTFLAGFTFIIPRILHLFGNFNEENAISADDSHFFVIEIVRITAGLIMILKSAGISDFIAERTGFDDSLKIYTKPGQLFSMLLIVIAIVHLTEQLPFIFSGLVYILTGTTLAKNGKGIGYSFSQWLSVFSHIVVPVLIIAFCKPLTKFFLRDIANDDDTIVIEHETIIIETTSNTEP